MTFGRKNTHRFSCSLDCEGVLNDMAMQGSFEMLSYVYFGTNDLKRATAFYDAALAPLGMPRCITNDSGVGSHFRRGGETTKTLAGRARILDRQTL